MKPTLLSLARLAAGVLLAGVALSACSANGADGPVLSDEEKIKQFDKGHGAYGGGAVPGAKPAPGAAAGK